MTAIAHESCQHRYYKLTCAEYARLLERAAGACELCGISDRVLEIDHDHVLGDMAVRGLICRGCNAIMGYVDAGRRAVDEVTERYLSQAFFLDLDNFLILKGPEFRPQTAVRLPAVQAALKRYVKHS